jgi:hypothetical protein
MMRLAVIFLIFMLACSQHKIANKHFDKIQKADRILIDYSSDAIKDTTVSADSSLLSLFEEVLGSKAETCSCPATGELIFYSKNSTLLKVEFSTYKADNADRCVFLMLNDEGKRKCYRMTYRVGMYLGFFMITEKK